MTAEIHSTIQNPERYHIQAVRKAVDVVAFLAERPHGASVTEVAHRLASGPGTAHRFLSTLCHEGLVEQHPQTLRYHLGYRVLQFAQSKLEALDVSLEAGVELDRLRGGVGETASLFVRVPAGCLCVQQFESPQLVRCAARIGDIFPVGGGAVGRALSSGQRRSVDVEISCEEVNNGMCAIAAPLIDWAGTVRGAITISIPRQRWDEQATGEWAEAVRRSAEAISRRLGWTGGGQGDAVAPDARQDGQ